jgi:DNA-binding CsgD family transcriptional regulator
LVYTLFTPAIHHADENIISPLVQYILYGVSIIGGAVLVFFPLQFYLYAGFCWFWGLIHIIEGGRTLGVLLYGLGIAFGYKKGFFKTWPRVKVIVILLVLLASLGSQVRYGMPYMMETVLQGLAFLIIGGLGVLLFMQDIRIEPLAAQPPTGIQPPRAPFTVSDAELKLSARYFSPRDVQILQQILARDKYEAIAAEQGIGLSTLKKMVASLFSLLALQNKTQFLKQYAHHTVMLIPDTVSEPSGDQMHRGTIIRFRQESS